MKYDYYILPLIHERAKQSTQYGQENASLQLYALDPKEIEFRQEKTIDDKDDKQEQRGFTIVDFTI